MSRKRGFTLIELITVMAITAILLTIIFIPVITGFNLTRAAQAYATAQDLARTLIRKIEREVGNSSGVRDNTGNRGAIAVVLPGQDGAAVASTLSSMKLDLIKPAEGDASLRDANGAFFNPDAGRYDPTLQSPKGQVSLPSTGGLTLVRYFVGLRAPLRFDVGGNPVGPGEYNNPYDGLMMKVNSGQDNLFVLYRAEIQVKVWDRNLRKYVVNGNLFVDADGDDQPDDIDDPAFFALLPGTDANYVTKTLTAAGLAKANRIGYWLKRSVLVTETSRFDMVAPVFDKASRKVHYVGNIPQLVPLVRFQPTRVTSEPAAGQSTVRAGEEGANMIKVGPDMFRTQYGLWSSLLMRMWPSAWPANYAANGDRAGNVRLRWDQGGNTNSPYMVARTWYDVNNKERFSLYGFDPTDPGMTNDLIHGVEVFDVTRYFEVRKLAKPDWNVNGVTYPYAYTEAVNAANARTSWLNSPLWRLNYVPFVPDTRNGQVVSSFDSREVGDDQAIPYDYRVPTWGQQSTIGLGLALRTGARVSPYNANLALDYTPNNDPDVGTGTWSDLIFQPVNRRFNKVWADFPLLAPGLDRSLYVKRFIDLRVSKQPDNTNGPMDPANGIARTYVTPGSEVVIGPDQRAGANFGKYVRYTRAAQRPVGANQYFINYVDQPEPDWLSLGINFTGIVGNLYSPLDYSPASLLQAVLQPQYRAGYVELNSRFGEPIPSGFTDLNGFHPTGNILVSYRFQFTEPNDVVAVDYDSTQIMEFSLTIRNYPQTQNLPNPQTMTVKGSAEVRNFVR